MIKKIFICSLALGLVTSTTTSSIACAVDNNKPVTHKQEEEQLLNYAQQSKSIPNNNPIDQQSIIFNNQKVIDSEQKIVFSFNLTNNSPILNHSQLLAHYQGEMVFNTKTQNFHLINHPFANPYQYVPGFYTSTLIEPSIIYGNPKQDYVNDFTIISTSQDLDKLDDDLSVATTGDLPLSKVFARQLWKNYLKFKSKAVPILTALRNFEKQSLWIVPSKNMAVIHIKLINNQYKIVWSNLNNQKDKNSLLSDGGINSIFWKGTIGNNQESSIFHLWAGRELLLELYQLYQLDPSVSNQWFTQLNLQKLFVNASGQNDKIEIANVKDPLYKSYNANSSDLILSLQSLLQGSNFKALKNLISKQYSANDLVFHEENGKFKFDIQDSGGLNIG